MTKKQKVNREDDPVYRPYERDSERKKKRSSHGKLNSFTWTIAEEILYVEFLQNHKQLFVDIKQRKKNKVFVAMSQFLKKRGPDQCRSHHQKMSIKFGNIDEIVKRITGDKILRIDSPQKDESSIEEFKSKQNCSTELEMQNDKIFEEKIMENEKIQTSSDFFGEEKHLWDYLIHDVWIGL